MKSYTVQVLMSTYNGANVLERQVESIIDQRGVDIHLLIRDDGSTDNTGEILRDIADKYTGIVEVMLGENEGWKRSFIDLLFFSGNYDFYCFSDQDDLWLKDKTIKEIEGILRYDADHPILVQCNAMTSDTQLHVVTDREYTLPDALDYKSAIAMEWFHGCVMLWNQKLMDILRMYKPVDEHLSHDYWVGLLACLFGTVISVDEPLIYHIRNGHNSSCDGDVSMGRTERLRAFLSASSSIYMNPVNDVIKGYNNMLSDEQKFFLSQLQNYQTSFLDKSRLIFDKQFVRSSLASTILLKLCILQNRY